MKKNLQPLSILIPLAIVSFSLARPAQTVFASPPSLPEFPKKNVWGRITPSVAWCGDPESAVTIEVHIVGRGDVRKVWVANLVAAEEDPPLEVFDDSSRGLLFYDDGSHGDAQAGDNVFTHDEIILPCTPSQVQSRGWTTFWGYVRVELADGSRQGENFGMLGGLIDPKYKGVFEIRDLGNNLSATAYALFIRDDQHEVMDSYPVANVYCGTSNYMAYRKLYSVLPDTFDVAMIMPGMQILRPKDLYENVPYDVLVSNAVEHIGLNPYDETARFGSAGRLKSVVFNSFGEIGISTHEVGHTWGMHLGASLGLIENPNNPLSHWSALTDIGGIMSAGYPDGAGGYGRFQYNGDETWSWIPNTRWPPYSPLELYVMGMIPPEEVPPVHVLQSPNLTDLNRITAASYATYTIDQIQAAEGGSRTPAAGASQKEFNVAFIVTQDTAYNEAAYAFFSVISHRLMSKDPPVEPTDFASFYWATGGRGTLNSRLPVDIADPAPPMDLAAATPTALLEPTPTGDEKTSVHSTGLPPSVNTPDLEPAERPASKSPVCNFPLLIGGMTILPGAWAAIRSGRKKRKA